METKPIEKKEKRVLRTMQELIEFARAKKAREGRLNKLGEWFAAGCPGALWLEEDVKE